MVRYGYTSQHPTGSFIDVYLLNMTMTLRKLTTYSLVAAGLLLSFPQAPAYSQASSAPEATLQLETAQPGYILGVGDQLEISVFGYEEFTGAKVILPDGTITLPILGAVRAAGQTPNTLTQDLTNRLQSYLVDPVVTINLTSLRPVVVNVAGEVQRPGPVQLRSVTATSLPNGGTPSAALEAAPTVSSALMEAGGVTRNADIRVVMLRRSLPSGETVTREINLWDAIWSENQPEDVVLQAGDSIFVPRLSEEDDIDRRLLARSSLSPDTIRVRVVGEVTRPGEVEVSPDSSLASAVATAGGPTFDANLRRVEFVRLQEDGTIDRQQIDLRNLSDDFQVQDGDVVIVPQRNTFRALDIAGRVLSPLGSLINIFTRF
jgi:polysaccharide export outer membrane protein